ncbi:uncharacterized protein LOC133834401 [Humulus lupulus]|uniref:uncharacterized protein LOC133834401 n=1 Tax=Humulus lupulus TaxID=3486 RepID=UPI002B41360A|nr:uncharacterized protein LOC133834401 [Humulus lupulus]
MGNYSCTLCRRLVPCSTKQGEVVRVVKIDGKVLTFMEPILVQDVVVKVSGDTNSSVIGLSKEALSSETLPLDYELKLGKVYYVVTSINKNPSGISSMDKEVGGVKRIKIVITKQQLKELLNKQISMEEVLLSGMEKSSTANWKPNLESIPEEPC